MLRIYQVDAFHHQILRGNPAAVIPLDQWLPDEQLQAIANENNLSETAFFLPEIDGAIPLRWFTPNKEVRLCGHATLATTHVLFQEIGYTKKQVRFNTLSGILTVDRLAEGYQMDFPADQGQSLVIDSAFADAIGTEVYTAFAGKDDLLLLIKDEDTLAALKPNQSKLAAFDYRGVIVSAPGNVVDFVSRCFYPNYGIAEDPVTGSAHTLMTPYWSERLGKTQLEARQISARGGILQVEAKGDRVLLSGQAVTYMRGQIFL